PASPPKRTLARPRAMPSAVHVGKNAVAPHVAPTVRAKCALDDVLGACLALEDDGAAIDQKGQMRIVGYGAVVAKPQRERLRTSTGRGHGLLSLRLSSRSKNALAHRRLRRPRPTPHRTN